MRQDMVWVQYWLKCRLQNLPDPSETNEADSAETGDQEVVIESKHLNEREAKWSKTEKECFAIVHAIEVFRPYLYGRSFTVFTDHRPLEWLMSKQNRLDGCSDGQSKSKSMT